MRRMKVLVGAATLAAAVLVPVAQGAKPLRVPVPATPVTLSDAVCGFPVLVEPIVNKETATIFSDGRVLVTGALVVRLTNLSDESKSVTVNISGPTHISPDGTFKGTGNWLLFQDPNALAPNGMALLTSGQIFLTFGVEPGSFSLEQKGGTQANVCDLLA